MARYRKKPIVIEAEQWFPGNQNDAVAEHKDKGTGIVLCGYIETLEGRHIVSPGDWVITGIKGEKYPCKPDIFELTYEQIEIERGEA